MLIVPFFILTGTHIVTMTMNFHGAVISIDICKVSPFCFNFFLNVEAIQSFTVDNALGVHIVTSENCLFRSAGGQFLVEIFLTQKPGSVNCATRFMLKWFYKKKTSAMLWRAC